MQKVEANVAKVVLGVPCRMIVPPVRVGKHDFVEPLLQHTCAMPPFGSMHWPVGVVAWQFVHAPPQPPPPQESGVV